jgi:hypothetical protein
MPNYLLIKSIVFLSRIKKDRNQDDNYRIIIQIRLMIRYEKDFGIECYFWVEFFYFPNVNGQLFSSTKTIF